MPKTVMYRSSFVTISKVKDTEYIFSFIKSTNDEDFLQSLHLDELTDSGMVETDIVETDKLVQYTMHLDSVQTLPQLLSHQHELLDYRQATFLLRSLGKQLSSLERNKKTILTFLPHNIVVLNETVFLYMDLDELYIISDDKTVLIDRPPQTNDFSSPELNHIKSIPSVVHKNNWMYSIASVVGFFITGNQRILSAHTEGTNTQEIFSSVLESIQDTPLLFCLLRCVAYNPHKRLFLYI